MDRLSLPDIEDGMNVLSRSESDAQEPESALVIAVGQQTSVWGCQYSAGVDPGFGHGHLWRSLKETDSRGRTCIYYGSN